ncbi:hypothetical protein DC3_49030 [Deinococcus cellulosilyticus NBRC 106333 = KACC 11606]|uniref:Uncharacterized protein n=1 Tax=Deinococcus cellulosilyticus (strain DSM 18568 / NBRC 106333 / KACC 11606 / 5516J-15) TaxID=1223518 RepID=A0A511N9U8_DEIC1|nr:hypothetical protein DC3_49030 [Deinococcus cellulosilyticus NBRC 106333 = KACC 11606]
MPDVQPGGNFANGEGLLDQEFNDVQAVGFGQGTESGGVQWDSSFPEVSLA